VTEQTQGERLPAAKRRPRGAQLYAAFERAVHRYSKVGHDPFPDMAHFPWAQKVEARWGDIREELDQLLDEDVPIPPLEEITANQRDLTNDGQWKAFFFVALGRQAERNIQRCPRTWDALQGIPGLKTALFSILEPGNVLKGHRGPYNGLLRYHLAVLIPEPREACSITVDGVKVHWTEGKSKIFDDTYWHHAVNGTNHRRVVLFADFVRPLRFPINIINRFFLFVMSKMPYMEKALENIQNYEDRPSAAKTAI
jgi:aspartyl/asparaginyl beta-hydroxylase (cupin superfamily)